MSEVIEINGVVPGFLFHWGIRWCGSLHCCLTVGRLLVWIPVQPGSLCGSLGSGADQRRIQNLGDFNVFSSGHFCSCTNRINSSSSDQKTFRCFEFIQVKFVCKAEAAALIQNHRIVWISAVLTDLSLVTQNSFSMKGQVAKMKMHRLHRNSKSKLELYCCSVWFQCHVSFCWISFFFLFLQLFSVISQQRACVKYKKPNVSGCRLQPNHNFKSPW